MAVYLTISELAYEFQMSRDTARKRLRDGNVLPAGPQASTEGKTAQLFSGAAEARVDTYELRAAIPALTGGVDGDPLRVKTSRQAELLKIQIEEKRGNLLHRFDVERHYADLAKRFVETLETLPDGLERDSGLTPAQTARAEQHIDRLREDLYEIMSSSPVENAT